MRHPFEPARLLLGLLMLGAAVVALVQAHGGWDVPAWAPAAMVPAGVLLVGVLGGVARLVRRAVRARRGSGDQD
ncbi:hypothetical protein [Streptomyces sulphureus]|uniref:hypothetical protein n=1 Tax=Streptomyces sulphureus TaxID=47758 RepID=UPI0003681531|nr:hypothetical protein [Streptomyces sulphureus]